MEPGLSRHAEGDPEVTLDNLLYYFVQVFYARGWGFTGRLSTFCECCVIQERVLLFGCRDIAGIIVFLALAPSQLS